MSWGDVMQALPLKLRRPTRRTSCPANNGWQSLGTLVQGGLVLNLDHYAQAYGWTKKVPPVDPAEHEFSDDGKQMGTGSLYGMPVARSSMIEAYYNRALLQRIGATVPKTYDDFVADLAKAKAAGVTPDRDGQRRAGRRHHSAVQRDERAGQSEDHRRPDLLPRFGAASPTRRPASRRRWRS